MNGLTSQLGLSSSRHGLSSSHCLLARRSCIRQIALFLRGDSGLLTNLRSSVGSLLMWACVSGSRDVNLGSAGNHECSEVQFRLGKRNEGRWYCAVFRLGKMNTQPIAHYGLSHVTAADAVFQRDCALGKDCKHCSHTPAFHTGQHTCACF